MLRTARRAVVAAALALFLGGCSTILDQPPTDAPQPFPGIVGELGRFGIDVSSWTSGDTGCDNPALSPVAFRFVAQGLDQPTPIALRIYLFGSRAAWDRRLADVDACAAAWATDPATFEQLQVSPYVVTGQGPWPPGFAEALKKAITEAAGSGG
jgi:hypothetical protein